MSNLKNLYLKEIKGGKDFFLSYLVILFLIFLLLLTRVGTWDSGVFLDLFYSLLLIIPLWYIIYSFDLLHREWKEGTIALLLGVPVKTAKILFAKMLALLTAYLFLSLAVTGGAVLLTALSGGTGEAVMRVVQLGLLTTMDRLLVFVPFTPAIFLVYLSGASLGRRGPGVRIVVGIVLTAIIMTMYSVIWRFWQIFLEVFGVPNFFVQFILNIYNKVPREHVLFSITWPYLFIIFLYLMGAVCFFLSIRLLEEWSRP